MLQQVWSPLRFPSSRSCGEAGSIQRKQLPQPGWATLTSYVAICLRNMTCQHLILFKKGTSRSTWSNSALKLSSIYGLFSENTKTMLLLKIFLRQIIHPPFLLACCPFFFPSKQFNNEIKINLPTHGWKLLRTLKFQVGYFKEAHQFLYQHRSLPSFHYILIRSRRRSVFWSRLVCSISLLYFTEDHKTIKRQLGYFRVNNGKIKVLNHMR